MISFSQGKVCRLLAILLAMPVGLLLGQSQHYRLADLANAATHHLPALLKKQAEINEAKAALSETRHGFLPQIRASEQVNIGTDNSIAGSYLPIGITVSSSAGV